MSELTNMTDLMQEVLDLRRQVALVEVRTEMDQLKEQVIEVVRTERMAVWEEAAKAWDGMEYSELAKAYPIGKYPKWGNIFAAWCREQARKEQR